MDILIKNMEMPKGNDVLIVDSAGTITKFDRWTGKAEATDPFKVKAIELPEHGRLIDADELYKIVSSMDKCSMSKVLEYILDAPAILEASDGSNHKM